MHSGRKLDGWEFCRSAKQVRAPRLRESRGRVWDGASGETQRSKAQELRRGGELGETEKQAKPDQERIVSGSDGDPLSSR